MKKRYISVFSIILVFILLFTASCNSTEAESEAASSNSLQTESKTEVASSTEGESQVESSSSSEAESEELKTEYTDNSGAFSPSIEINNEMKLIAKSDGGGFGGDFVINFDGKEDSYSFAPFGVEGGLHDCYSCKNCKYEEKNGTMAYHLCDDPLAHSGITVTLKTPIKATIVSGIKMTFMTTDEIKNASQIRLQTKNATNASDIVNHSGCPDISGATEGWKTVDFNMNASHISSLADDDGYIRAFKFYFRDKDSTDVYIKSFSFTTSIKELCRVNALTENYYSRGDALEAIAQRIKSNLSEIGIGAELELRVTDYIQNTTEKNGRLTYRLTVTTADGNRSTFGSMTTVIKKLEGVWLPLGHEIFKAERDSKEQYKSGFDRSGILCLENNVLKATEALSTVEYAVINKGVDVTDASIKWFAPHVLEICEDGISKLFINAHLDYGHRLIEGADYRFVVRGVTENENYILHLDIPFTYSPLSKKAAEAIENAAQAMMDVGEMFVLDEGDKTAMIKESIEEIIGNDSIIVTVRPVAEGVNRGIFEYYFSYKGDVSSARFPSYTLDGTIRSDFYAYPSSFYSSRIFANYDLLPSMDIDLLAPYDGQENLRIASDEIVSFWDTDTDKLITHLHDYKKGELCDPVPVRLEWSSKISGAFTIKVSEYEDLRDAWAFATANEYYDVYNLKAGTRYYWRVESGDTVSKTYTFVTEAGYPRYILSDKVSNFRDLGGHATVDGKIVKQGLAFRFSNFDSLSEADKVFINAHLGIKTELDLRGERSTSTLGSHVTAIPVSIKWYSGIFEEGESEPIRRAISVFANKENYPIGYHCAIGRDRTGTVSILLLGLLGVDEDTILKEYMVSKKSVSGNGEESPEDLYNNFTSLVKRLNKYGDDNSLFKDRVEEYLLSIGITKQEIATIREIFLEN